MNYQPSPCLSHIDIARTRVVCEDQGLLFDARLRQQAAQRGNVLVVACMRTYESYTHTFFGFIKQAADPPPSHTHAQHRHTWQGVRELVGDRRVHLGRRLDADAVEPQRPGLLLACTHILRWGCVSASSAPPLDAGLIRSNQSFGHAPKNSPKSLSTMPPPPPPPPSSSLPLAPRLPCVWCARMCVCRT